MDVVDARFERPVFARLRRLCLEPPDTTEALSHGHPIFRAGRQMFCALEIVRGRPSIALKAPPAEIERLSRKKEFFATPYGRNVWISRWLDIEIDWRGIERLIKRSHEHSAARKTANRKAPRRRSAKTSR